jgi:2-amino-4-hydroxy-6-hydroxymethyldihydropteridine diphosphokinase
MPRVGIALGSNLGDCRALLQAARDGLRQIATAGEPFLQASDHQTEPLHCPPGSPPFLNSVIELDWQDTSAELLDITQMLEKTLGRISKSERNAARLIDIDLLYFGTEIITTEHLILPHPRIAERRFVLAPLAEIRPDLVLPGQTLSVSELAAVLESLG